MIPGISFHMISMIYRLWYVWYIISHDIHDISCDVICDTIYLIWTGSLKCIGYFLRCLVCPQKVAGHSPELEINWIWLFRVWDAIVLSRIMLINPTWVTMIHHMLSCWYLEVCGTVSGLGAWNQLDLPWPNHLNTCPSFFLMLILIPYCSIASYQVPW